MDTTRLFLKQIKLYFVNYNPLFFCCFECLKRLDYCNSLFGNKMGVGRKRVFEEQVVVMCVPLAPFSSSRSVFASVSGRSGCFGDGDQVLGRSARENQLIAGKNSP